MAWNPKYRNRNFAPSNQRRKQYEKTAKLPSLLHDNFLPPNVGRDVPRDKVCFEFWKNAVCTKRNCNSIHKPLTWDEPFETVSRYFYYLIETKNWDASLEIYRCLLIKGETTQKKKLLTSLCLALLSANNFLQAFQLVADIEQLEIQHPLLLWSLLSTCHLIPSEQKQLRSTFINYLIKSDIKLDARRMREALDNIVILPDKITFWNFLLFAVKQDFSPSPLACTIAIEALIEEKFHIPWVLKLFLKMASEDVYKVNPKNIEFLREVTKTFCIAQNLARLDAFLDKLGFRSAGYEEESGEPGGNSPESSVADSVQTLKELATENPCDEKLWSHFLRIEVIKEDDFAVLLEWFLRDLTDVAEKFRSFYSFANARIKLEDPSNMPRVNDRYWLGRLAIELMLTCSNQMQPEEAYKILVTAMSLRISVLHHHAIATTELVLAVVQICLKTGHEYTAIDVLRAPHDFQCDDFQHLASPMAQPDELEALQFIISQLRYHRSAIN